MTITATTTRFDTCNCSFAKRARIHLMGDGELDGIREVHDRLLRIENMDPVEALILFAEVMLDEIHPISPVDDLDYFVGEHNWQDPAAVWDVFHMFHTVAMKSVGLRS